MKELINKIQHVFNPLHVFVRLIEEGYDPQHALELASLYEDIFYEDLVSNMIKILEEADQQNLHDDKK